ncbi:hypothetical protein LWP59_28800 [Amycolatopsis acidiphila]|nr:hypothetical protein LWP59_28800 [Amycolatopsis acidiphila]
MCVLEAGPSDVDDPAILELVLVTQLVHRVLARRRIWTSGRRSACPAGRTPGRTQRHQTGRRPTTERASLHDKPPEELKPATASSQRSAWPGPPPRGRPASHRRW